MIHQTLQGQLVDLEGSVEEALTLHKYSQCSSELEAVEADSILQAWMTTCSDISEAVVAAAVEAAAAVAEEAAWEEWEAWAEWEDSLAASSSPQVVSQADQLEEEVEEEIPSVCSTCE